MLDPREPQPSTATLGAGGRGRSSASHSAALLRRLRALFRRRAVTGVVIAFVVTLGVHEARSLRLLLSFELGFHDALLRLQPAAQRTQERVSLIRIREQDIDRYGHPLPDATMAEALERILASHPRAIGVDLYRDRPVGAGEERLRALFATSPRLVAIEKLPEADRPGTPPPAWLRGSQQVAFSDVLPDGDGVVRRALLFLWDAGGERHTSLALRLALVYLADEGVTLTSRGDSGESLALGQADLSPFMSGDAVYVGADDRGYQMLLDQRRGLRPFDAYSIEALLSGAVPEEALQDRVVIMGTTAPSVKDLFLTPFKAPSGGRRVANGIEIHAQAVDQLLRRALDGDPPVRSPAPRTQLAGVALLSLLGAALVLGARSVRVVWMAGLAISVLLVGGAWALLGRAVWLPVVPPLLGFVGSSGLAMAHVLREERREKAVLRELFSRHVSKRVLEELWRKRDQFMEEGRLRTQRLTVTVLMGDLQGYTAASEKMEPAALLDWLNEFMGVMAHLVETGGGVVDDFWGDGLKANFSVPVPRTTDGEIRDDARAAVACAVAMAREMERLDAGWRARGLPTGRMRVGIHTGPVVAGSVGSAERLKYTSVGDTVNVAARLENVDRDVFLAETGTVTRILVSEETRRLLGEDVLLHDMGPRSMPGRVQPVHVWRVLPSGDQKEIEQR